MVEKLTWKTEYTCADVRRLRIMCSAIFFRITDIFSTRSAPAGLATCGARVTGSGGAGAAAGWSRPSCR